MCCLLTVFLTDCLASLPCLSFFTYQTVKGKKGKGGKNRPKIDKNMISTPSNFQHLGHIGLDSEGGFDVDNIPPEWRSLLDEAKIDIKELENEDTRKFIEEFVQAQGE